MSDQRASADTAGVLAPPPLIALATLIIGVTADWLLPLNEDVPETVNPDTGAPIPTTLTGLTSDVYRGLEYSILKQKDSKIFTTASNISGEDGASIAAHA